MISFMYSGVLGGNDERVSFEVTYNVDFLFLRVSAGKMSPFKGYKCLRMLPLTIPNIPPLEVTAATFT